MKASLAALTFVKQASYHQCCAPGPGAQAPRAGHSPTTSLEHGERLQAFTAIGQVADVELYQVEMAPGFVPWRRNVNFVDCAETPIGPLIDSLSFIKDKKRWGYIFRFGLFEIPQEDFELIRRAMVIDG